MTFKGRAERIIKKLALEGRVIVISKEISNKINHEIGEVAAQAKKEFIKMEKISRAYIADVESGRINLYKTKPFYRKIFNYFS